MVTVWCDNYGRWHARVNPAGTLQAQRQRARRAIVREIKARERNERPVIRLRNCGLTDGARVFIERD